MDASPRPTLLMMAGPPGSGKSTIALAVSSSLHWPVVDKDTLKSAALQASVPEAIAGKLSYDLMFDIANDILVQQQLSIILDSPAGYEAVMRKAQAMADSANATLKVILCLADRSIRIQRLTERVPRPSQWTTINQTGEDAWREQRGFFPADNLVLRTNRPIPELTKKAVAYLEL